ncbi:DUF6891 domain-containing protein [Streptomyces griseocarneus]|uniref:DUF6891 domain-containing protein n=1 Tax=Streptomyces griseocarneus TaxID=51201 RepID=UPI00167D845D|nr:hypothetical protein [Streptomyces griseocarneus]MBZ6475128.1 hypothetical protein [Streptomyces griseocarneus]GHG62110.1 hypothetical protein GCM10018779_30520 [Streptomyces griseocarneus]
MLAITVNTEAGGRHVRATEAELAGLVRRIGADDDHFLVLSRIPDLPDVFLQVWHETGGGYTLEHRDGAHDRHFQVALDGPEPVIAAMTGWARRQNGWDAGLEWTPMDFPAPAPIPPLELDEEERELLEDRLRELLVGGYTTRAELAEVAEDYLVSGDRRPVSHAQARQLADLMWQERVEEQASWEGTTDPERLSLVFAALDAAGITARENFTCCRTCGQSEIGAEAAPDARGFVYFHTQCTDSAAAGYGLTLLYGGFDGSADTTAAIGEEVASALRSAGLQVDWNGDPSRALTVTPLDWRKRLVG